MEKLAPLGPEVHELIRRRWSPRAFADRPLDRETIRCLLEAAQWAPSSYNEQPWIFLVASKDDPDSYARILGCLIAFNQSWAKQAPLLLLSVARLGFARNGKPNPHAAHDVGLATAQLVLQATALGLVAHQMAGYDADEARRACAIPEGYAPVAAIAVGYPGDPESLPEDLRDKEMAPRSRKELAEIAFSGRWGRAAL